MILLLIKYKHVSCFYLLHGEPCNVDVPNKSLLLLVLFLLLLLLLLLLSLLILSKDLKIIFQFPFSSVGWMVD